MQDELLAVIGHNIRTLRIEKKLSQESLAAAAGCHRNYIGLIERGERNPTITIVAAIAAVLGCTPDDLMFDRRDLPPSETAG